MPFAALESQRPESLNTDPAHQTWVAINNLCTVHVDSADAKCNDFTQNPKADSRKEQSRVEMKALRFSHVQGSNSLAVLLVTAITPTEESSDNIVTSIDSLRLEKIFMIMNYDSISIAEQSLNIKHLQMLSAWTEHSVFQRDPLRPVISWGKSHAAY